MGIDGGIGDVLLIHLGDDEIRVGIVPNRGLQGGKDSVLVFQGDFGELHHLIPTHVGDEVFPLVIGKHVRAVDLESVGDGLLVVEHDLGGFHQRQGIGPFFGVVLAFIEEGFHEIVGIVDLPFVGIAEVFLLPEPNDGVVHIRIQVIDHRSALNAQIIGDVVGVSNGHRWDFADREAFGDFAQDIVIAALVFDGDVDFDAFFFLHDGGEFVGLGLNRLAVALAESGPKGKAHLRGGRLGKGTAGRRLLPLRRGRRRGWGLAFQRIGGGIPSALGAGAKGQDGRQRGKQCFAFWVHIVLLLFAGRRNHIFVFTAFSALANSSSTTASLKEAESFFKRVVMIDPTCLRAESEPLNTGEVNKLPATFGSAT